MLHTLLFPWSCWRESSAGCVAHESRPFVSRNWKKSSVKSGNKKWGLNNIWNRQPGEPLPCPTPPSSVNDSYSACAVVYSFPAVKGCPLKVPFVHRLHFVIQIAPFFSNRLEVAGCPWVPRGGQKGRRRPFSAQGQLFFPSRLRNESPPLYLPYILSSFSKPYIYKYIYIVQKETGVN